MEEPSFASAADLRGEQTFVQRAAALREKYRVLDVGGDVERQISPEAVAPHPSNRNGVRMNVQRLRGVVPPGFPPV